MTVMLNWIDVTRIIYSELKFKGILCTWSCVCMTCTCTGFVGVTKSACLITRFQDGFSMVHWFLSLFALFGQFRYLVEMHLHKR